MASMEAESIDAVICDPPYGIRFMGSAWDGKAIEEEMEKPWNQEGHMRLTGSPDSLNRKLIPRSGSGYRNRAGAAGAYDFSAKGNYAFQEWTEKWATEALRVLKPGGHILSFSSTRTYHRMVCGIEDAGFNVRDTLVWINGQSFPKSLNLPGGLGTSLKKCLEPIVLARKPVQGTVQENVTSYGTGALNITATRLGDDDEGRWPASVLLSHNENCRVIGFRTIPGRTIRRPVDGMLPFGGGAGKKYDTIWFRDDMEQIWDCVPGCPVGSLGETARFYFCAKVSVAERNAGCEEGQSIHPTLKPIDLMRWLCRLISPPGGTVLDCFLGSGSTGIAAHLEGFDFIGVEREENYMGIAKARTAWWREHGEDGLRIVAEQDKLLREGERKREEKAEAGQLELL